MIELLLDLFDATWVARNKLKHGEDEHETNTMQDEKLNDAIETACSHDQELTDPDDDRIFRHTVAESQARTLKSK